MIDRRKDHKLIASKIRCPVDDCRAFKGRKCKGLTDSVHIMRREAYVQMYSALSTVID